MITTCGRSDLDNLFRSSDVLTSKQLRHTPFLAFREVDGGVVVEKFDRATKLQEAGLPRTTRVMVQWAGQHRSDWFQMTAGDVCDALEARARR